MSSSLATAQHYARPSAKTAKSRKLPRNGRPVLIGGKLRLAGDSG
jgi:hypothetical protein